MDESVMKAILLPIVCMVTGGWLASSVAWADPPFPVPPKGGLVACKADLAICNGDLDSCDIALGTCSTDLTTCKTDLGTCDTNLTATTAELATCTSDLATCEASAQAFPATGQTTCWDSSSNEISCDGTGQDGEIQAGADLSFADNGLTITDNNTKLEWMKQDDNNTGCGSYPGNLDQGCTFDWDEAFAFVAELNTNNHAGYSDWRVPNVKELQSIAHFGESGTGFAWPAEFDSGCEVGCTVVTCSCGPEARYWSSTTNTRVLPGDGFTVEFQIGTVDITQKSDNLNVRAVRGGL